MNSEGEGRNSSVKAAAITCYHINPKVHLHFRTSILFPSDVPVIFEAQGECQLSLRFFGRPLKIEFRRFLDHSSQLFSLSV